VGAFYDSIAARLPREAVAKAVGEAYDAALVGPTRQGWTIAAPDGEGRLHDHLAEVAVVLSRQAPVLCTTVHDDDILLLQAYEGGALVATYDSCPGYFGEGPTAPDVSQVDELARVLGIVDTGPVTAVLSADYDLETDRLSDVAPLLGLPPYLVLFGYDYAAEGDLPQGLELDDLQRLGTA
jgi:hypothetical protein